MAERQAHKLCLDVEVCLCGQYSLLDAHVGLHRDLSFTHRRSVALRTRRPACNARITTGAEHIATEQGPVKETLRSRNVKKKGECFC